MILLLDSRYESERIWNKLPGWIGEGRKERRTYGETIRYILFTEKQRGRMWLNERQAGGWFLQGT